MRTALLFVGLVCAGVLTACGTDGNDDAAAPAADQPAADVTDGPPAGPTAEELAAFT